MLLGQNITMIKFNTLGLTNFMSVQAPILLDLSSSGLFLITGKNLDEDIVSNSNGAGKSTLLEALVWVLFGKALRVIAADEVVNRQKSSGTYVVVTFSIRDNNYTIERFRKHEKYNNSVIVVKDGIDISKTTMKQNQELIEQIIGMNYTTFVNSIVFGHGLTDFFTSLNDNSKKELLEDILELKIFSNCQDMVKSRLKIYSNSIANVEKKSFKVGSEYRQLGSQTDKLSELIEELKNKELVEKETLNSKLEDLKIDLEKQVIEEAQIRTELQSLTELIKKEEQGIASQSRNLEEETIKIRSRLETLKFQEETILDEIKLINSKILALQETYLDKVCPFCGRLINEEQMPCVLSSTMATFAEKNVLLSKIRKDTSTYLKETRKLGVDPFNLNVQYYKELGERKASLQNSLLNISVKIATTETEIDSTLKEINAASQLGPLMGMRMNNVTMMGESLKQQTQLMIAQSALVDKKKYLEFWDIGFSQKGLRAWALNSYLPYINRLINNYASNVGLTAVGIELKPMVVVRSGDEIDKIELVISGGVPYNSFSSGERRRIDLSILFALQEVIYNRTANPINILFFDEIFDTLDETGSEIIIQVLELLCTKFYDSIFVISHNEWLKPYFKNQIQVVRESKRTYLEVNQES